MTPLVPISFISWPLRRGPCGFWSELNREWGPRTEWTNFRCWPLPWRTAHAAANTVHFDFSGTEDGAFAQQVLAHQREIAGLRGAKDSAAVELETVRDAVRAAEAQLAEIHSQTNSANYHRQKAAENIQALIKQINGGG